MTCIYHYSVIQGSLIALKILCALTVHPFQPLSPANQESTLHCSAVGSLVSERGL